MSLPVLLNSCHFISASIFNFLFLIQANTAFKNGGGHAERSGFKYMEARFGRPDFELWEIIGNLRTTTKITTTTSTNRERTGASTSVSAEINELKKRSRSTTTEMRTVRYGFF